MLNVFSLGVLVTFLTCVRCQGQIDDECTLKSNGSPGVCKLLNDCGPAVDDLKQHSRFPQTCGFQGTQPIVCCPLESKPPQRTPGEISRRKCREYSAYVLEKKKPPILIIDAPPIVKNECGHKVVKLIVGGQPAERKEFPHMAAIGFEKDSGDIQWLCGGTILSNKFILTAAHCLNNHAWGDAKWVRLGVSDLNDTYHRQDVRVAERIAYPEYLSSSHYHDIGLLRLTDAIKLNPYARPACIYLKRELSVQRALATGWGQTSWGGSASNNLLKVTIDLFHHDFCNSSYKNQIGRKLARGIVDEIQVCAGSVDEEKDTCQGDSGGPLQIYHVGDNIKCMYDIVGVTSFGKACSGSPGVYVRVSHYVKWIEDNVWPQTT